MRVQAEQKISTFLWTRSQEVFCVVSACPARWPAQIRSPLPQPAENFAKSEVVAVTLATEVSLFFVCSHLKRDRCLPTTGQHSVRSQAKVTASAGQRRGDIKMVDCGRGLTKTNLVLKLSFVHERHGASRARASRSQSCQSARQSRLYRYV